VLAVIGMPIETTNAPPLLSSERREKFAGFSIFVIVASLNPSSTQRA
jgi:hypothetical protein